MQELFGDVGQISYARLISPGNAEVCYMLRADALNAIDKYDRRELDGIPMDIQLVEVNSQVPSHRYWAYLPRYPSIGNLC